MSDRSADGAPAGGTLWGHPKELYALLALVAWVGAVELSVDLSLILIRYRIDLLPEWSRSMLTEHVLFEAVAPIAGGFLLDRFITRRAWGVLIGSFALLLNLLVFNIFSTRDLYLRPELLTVTLLLNVIGAGFLTVSVPTFLGELYGGREPALRTSAFILCYASRLLGIPILLLVRGLPGGSRMVTSGVLAGGCFAITTVWLLVSGKNLVRADVRSARAGDPSGPISRAERSRVAALVVLAACMVVLVVGSKVAVARLPTLANAGLIFIDVLQYDARFSIDSTIMWRPTPWLTVLPGLAFAALWPRVSRRMRGISPSAPTAMAIGCGLLALGYLIVFGLARLRISAPESGPWSFAARASYAIGMLCVFPVGSSIVARLAPPRHRALLMGLLITAFSWPWTLRLPDVERMVGSAALAYLTPVLSASAVAIALLALSRTLSSATRASSPAIDSLLGRLSSLPSTLGLAFGIAVGAPSTFLLLRYSPPIAASLVALCGAAALVALVLRARPAAAPKRNREPPLSDTPAGGE